MRKTRTACERSSSRVVRVISYPEDDESRFLPGASFTLRDFKDMHKAGYLNNRAVFSICGRVMPVGSYKVKES